MRPSHAACSWSTRGVHQRAAAGFLGTLLAATCWMPAQAAGDMTLPTVQVTTPAPDQLFNLGSLAFEGTATDNAGVAP
jgi:hypothetical protein